MLCLCGKYNGKYFLLYCEEFVLFVFDPVVVYLQKSTEHKLKYIDNQFDQFLLDFKWKNYHNKLNFY